MVMDMLRARKSARKSEDERVAEYVRLMPRVTVFHENEVDTESVKREAALEAMRAVATSFSIDPMKSG
jgi:hypothetical protein